MSFYDICNNINGNHPVTVWQIYPTSSPDFVNFSNSGNNVIYLSPTNNLNDTNITLFNQEYDFIGIKGTGFASSLDGKMPEYTVTIDLTQLDTNTVWQALKTYWTQTLGNDGFPNLVGITLYRIRSDNSYANTTPYAADKYTLYSVVDRMVVEKVTTRTKTELVLSCKPAIGLDITNQAQRVIGNNLCTLRYRVPIVNQSGQFHYVPVQEGGCPYQGTTYYNSADAVTTDWRYDYCPKTLTSCMKRFANGGDNTYTTSPLPFYGTTRANK